MKSLTKRGIIGTVAIIAVSLPTCQGFSNTPYSRKIHQQQQSNLVLHAVPEYMQENEMQSRRKAIQSMAFGITSLLLSTPSANAAEKEPTIYKSGKAPIVPGQKPKDKNDVAGTRKDPNFLRSVSACKSQCEQTNGPDGYARSKEECLSDCQDICCTTYEQCTFGIVPRM